MPKSAETAFAAGPWWFTANEVLAFLLELVAFAVLGWWGVGTGDGAAARIALGAGVPVAAMVLWALFAAPKARLRPALPGVLLVKALVFCGAAAAVYDLGHPVGGIVLAVVAGANTALAEVFRPRFVPHRARPASP
ncbi:YrdB family protein [Streptomyces sp. NPDC048566]|uniref:YrdB family protein n=1 Tax=Streptomyces sp. NPDC048566 TaxID=3365569 RepID=UPI0037141FCD